MMYALSDPLVGPARISLTAVLTAGCETSAVRMGPRVSFRRIVQLSLLDPVWPPSVLARAAIANKTIGAATTSFARAFISFFLRYILLSFPGPIWADPTPSPLQTGAKYGRCQTNQRPRSREGIFPPLSTTGLG